jgi:GTP-binding protein
LASKNDKTPSLQRRRFLVNVKIVEACQKKAYFCGELYYTAFNSIFMQDLRNIAIIAHVDHGKTTLVDKMLLAGQLFADHQKPGELIMDNNDLERERGITILSKNVSMRYKGTKINIIDTPGHSDFGGEVERVLNMADGVLLLVDAFEGPMPQTRFVLQKALELGLKPLVVINKVDKPNCTPEEVQDSVFDLMFNLDATEEQLDFPTIFGSAKLGWMGEDWQTPTSDITYLLDQIVEHIPPPQVLEGPLQMQITSLDFSKFIGRIAVGRLYRGTLQKGQRVALIKRDGTEQKSQIKSLYTFEGLEKKETDEVNAGDICAVVGIEGFEIGDTIADAEHPEALPAISIDEPTMSMLFTINDSPFFGQEGKFVTSRHVNDRLDKELEKNLALRVESTEKADAFRVYGRGVLHLSVLIETMRREGYELQIGQPQVILKEIDGQTCEPVEELTIDLPDAVSGKAIEMVTRRKGMLKSMEPKGDRVILRFDIPSRGIIGLRSQMLTATAGEAIMTHRFESFEPHKGEIPGRINGSLISMETGKSIPYSIANLQERGKFFIGPNEEIYEGQICGENSRPGDLVVNLTKTKKLTNMRSSGADDKLKLVPPIRFTLEEALEYIQEDEYVEVTPESIRLRKIFLKEHDRKRMRDKKVAIS